MSSSTAYMYLRFRVFRVKNTNKSIQISDLTLAFVILNIKAIFLALGKQNRTTQLIMYLQTKPYGGMTYLCLKKQKE